MGPAGVSSKREQIIAALHVVAKTVNPAILRNVALGEMTGDRFEVLRDGDLDLTEEFVNAGDAIYEFTASPTLIIVVEKGASPNAIDKILDDRIGEYVDAFEAIATSGMLGGLITAIRVNEADFAPKELFGTEDKKGAELTIELDYWSGRRSG